MYLGLNKKHIMKKLSLFIVTSTFIIASCGGGGGGDSEPAVIEPSFSFEVPTTLTNNSTPSSSGCTGTSWDDCIKLTATANDPQNRLITKEWRTYNSNPSICEPYTRQGDNIISSTLYCGHQGYSCSYSYQWDWRNIIDGDNFTDFGFQDFRVNVNAIPCAAASGVGNGYIQEANIFVDSNKNFIQDNNEQYTSTGQLGQFSFEKPIIDDSLVILRGGIDSATNLEMPENYTLIGIAGNDGKFIISPISSIAYFMDDSFSPNDSLGIKLFDIFSYDPIIQLNSEEASTVILTNIKISIITETISQALNQDDYLKIYGSIAKTMTDKEISLKEISSKELIFETITDIDSQDMINMNDAIYISEKMNSFLDSIIIDESNEYLQKFEKGLKTLPKEIQTKYGSNEKEN